MYSDLMFEFTLPCLKFYNPITSVIYSSSLKVVIFVFYSDRFYTILLPEFTVLHFLLEELFEGDCESTDLQFVFLV